MYTSHFVFIAKESSIKENRLINSVTAVGTKTLKTCFTHIFNRPEIGKKNKIKTFHVSLPVVDLHFQENVCKCPNRPRANISSQIYNKFLTLHHSRQHYSRWTQGKTSTNLPPKGTINNINLFWILRLSITYVSNLNIQTTSKNILFFKNYLLKTLLQPPQHGLFSDLRSTEYMYFYIVLEI